ncbi:MAG: PAS domain S-box protein [Bacteroidetes bacterium]|nr:PAS domain S-box protein [Bacteroidota bacterium]
MIERNLGHAAPDSENKTKDSTLRILLLEDNPIDAELVETELRKGGISLVSKRVETRDAFAEELKTLDPDVVLSDFSLPRFDAFGALEIYKSSRSNAAFILVTGSQSEEVAVECIKRGADDYILKTTLKRLPSAVRGALEKKRNEMERRKAIAAQRETEANYRNIFDNMITGIYQTALDGRFITANPAMARILGYETPDEMMSTVSAFGERFYVDKERRAEFIRLILEHGFISEFESQVYKKDGSVIWISENARTVAGAGGRLMGFEGTTVDITGRKRAQEALRQAEEKYRAIFDEAIVGIFQTTSDGRYLAVNPAMARMYGYDSPADLMRSRDDIGRQVYVDPRRRDEFRRVMQERGLVEKFEYEVYQRDGNRRWWSENARTIRDENGIVISYIGTVEDITERKLALDEQARLVAMLEATTDFVATADMDGRGVYINRAGRRMLGINENTDASTLTISMGHPDWARKLVLNEAIPTATREGIWRGETAILSGDGREIPVLQVIIAHKDQNGEVQFLSTIARDISELKRREEKIREQAALLDKTQDAIMVRDLEDRILFWSKGAEKMYGWSAKEAIGRKVTEILFKDIPPEFEEGKKKVTEEGEWVGELKQTTRTGNEIIVDARLTLVRDEKGCPQSILAIKTDITEKKSIENQLLRSQRLESIGTLASGIAHDFNNVLGIILGYADSLDVGNPDPARLSTSVYSINKAVQRGAALVGQILTFARKTDVVPEPVNVALVVKELLRMLEETFPKTVTISAQTRDDLPIIRMDSGQLHQALLNLCLNARDAVLDRNRDTGTSGSVLIKTDVVTPEQLSGMFDSIHSAKRYCCISVSDTGIGMDEATKARIFEPFFTTKGPGRGTGLGLAVVYGIVQGHGGFVDVDSKVGEGTTFRLYFPIVDFAENEESDRDAARIEGLQGHETILIVDDEELILNMLQMFLKDMGYNIFSAADGQNALDTYIGHQRDIALVVTDMGLPLFDGVTLFSKLKAINPGVKVVIASGYVDTSFRSQLINSGIIDVIQKPYSPRLVAKRIREILDNENA